MPDSTAIGFYKQIKGNHYFKVTDNKIHVLPFVTNVESLYIGTSRPLDLSEFTALTDLRIPDAFNISRETFTPKLLSNIRQLHFGSEPEAQDFCETVVVRMPNLTSLTTPSYDVVTQLTQLETLHFTDDFSHNSAFLSSETWSRFCNLKELRFIDQFDDYDFSETFSNLTSLKTLIFHASNLYEPLIIPNLETLCVYGNVDDDAILEMTTLTSLTIHEHERPFTGACLLDLPSLTSLCLDVHSHSVFDPKFLRDLTGLTELSLEYMKLDEDILRNLTNLKKLSLLDFKGSSLTPETKKMIFAPGFKFKTIIYRKDLYEV